MKGQFHEGIPAIGLLCWLAIGHGAAAGAAQIRTLSGVTGNDMTYDKVHNRLYISSLGPTGNSLSIIDPVTATLGTSIVVGTEPRKVAVSDDGQFAYVGLHGVGAVRQIDLATFTAGQQFSLGSSTNGTLLVDDMEVMPGSPQTVAISLRNRATSPRHEGVAIFDNGVKRPTTTLAHTGSNQIEFGATPDRLYGYNNETTDFGFRTMSISATGVQQTNLTTALIDGFFVTIKYGGGKIVSSSGRVIDAANRKILGTLSASGPVAVEEDGTRAYIATAAAIKVFDLDTRALLDTIDVPSLSGASQIVRFGGDGLAVRGADGVYLVNSTSVPEAGSAIVALAGVIAFANGRRVPRRSSKRGRDVHTM